MGSSDDEEVRELLSKLVKKEHLPVPFGGERRELLHLFPPRPKEVRDELRFKVIKWDDPDPRTHIQPEQEPNIDITADFNEYEREKHRKRNF